MNDTGHASDAADPRILRAEDRLALLSELCEIGMDLARRIKLEFRLMKDPVGAFARISRAIRLTVALAGRIDDALAALRARAVAAPAKTPAAAPSRPVVPASSRDDRAPLARGEAPAREPEAPSRNDFIEPPERLTESDRFGPLLELSFEDAVRWICQQFHRDGDHFLRNWSPPPPVWSPAPGPASSDVGRVRVRADVVDAINTKLVRDGRLDIADADLALKTLDQRLFNSARYDVLIGKPLIEVVRMILTDLGLSEPWSDEPWALPPPDPPPRGLRAP